MASKPRFVFRGLRRQLMRKLQNALLSIQKMDLRESIRAGTLGVTGDYFADSDVSVEGLAVRHLLERIDNRLLLKA